MADQKNKKPVVSTKQKDEALAAKEARLEREAKALRANLLRRKQQQRARQSSDPLSPREE
ncbi:hypothetical protein [Swingsia samuiensis]|uniref:Uncharacterized protein n=1 Tax=Swingsia samuiensis TaxID=1293412 RepID=A0A4Y6UJN1_9PROT|nr:hypothetical protein [Swingsia samuiensis]QDH17020.1 hypothetical protein E3D00_05165 [Swingsia samuiensis]